MFIKRNHSLEMMDDFSIKDKRIDYALNELKIINKYLGGYSTSTAGVKKLLGKTASSNIKILDAGAGASFPFLSMKINNLNIELFSVDKNIRACKYLKRNSSNLKVVCADIFNLPFKGKNFDIIHASLFLHHFNDKQLKNILVLFERCSTLGIIVNDLRRNILAYLAIKMLTILFSGSEMVKNDAPLSVKRGFIKPDLLRLISEIKFSNYEINRRWAFRWLIVIYSGNYGL